MLCNHKFGNIQKDGFQYCKKCGKALRPKCEHVYEIYSNEILEYARTKTLKKRVIINKCKFCGILDKFEIYY